MKLEPGSIGRGGTVGAQMARTLAHSSILAKAPHQPWATGVIPHEVIRPCMTTQVCVVASAIVGGISIVAIRRTPVNNNIFFILYLPLIFSNKLLGKTKIKAFSSPIFNANVEKRLFSQDNVDKCLFVLTKQFSPFFLPTPSKTVQAPKLNKLIAASRIIG